MKIIGNKMLSELTATEIEALSLCMMPGDSGRRRADRWSIEENKALRLTRWLSPDIRYWRVRESLAKYGLKAPDDAGEELRQISERLRADLLSVIIQYPRTRGWLLRQNQNANTAA